MTENWLPLFIALTDSSMISFEWTSSYHLLPINNLSARVSCFRLTFVPKNVALQVFDYGVSTFFFALFNPHSEPAYHLFQDHKWLCFIHWPYLLCIFCQSATTSSAQPSPLPSLHPLAFTFLLLKSTTTEIKTVQLILANYDPWWPKRHGQGKIWHK